MSKILPKSVPSQSSQNRQPAQNKVETPGKDLLFSAIFGGAASELSSKKVEFTGSPGSGLMSAPSQNHSEIDEHANSELLALIATVPSGRGLSEKATVTSEFDLENDTNATQPNVFVDEENFEAIASSVVAGSITPTGHGGSMTIPKTNREPLAKMLFDDTADNQSVTGNKLGSGKVLDPAGSGGNLGAAKVSSSLKVQSSVDFIGPMPAHQADVKVVNDAANLRALKALNLDQRNAEIDTEILVVETRKLLGTPEKKFLDAGSLKQAMLMDGNHLMTSKMSLSGENGQRVGDMGRTNSAPHIGVDSGSPIGAAASNSSSNGQTGGQTGQQTGGQTGTPTGGSLINNLNALQNLDTAKGNWTEMLLQRVQKGLAGGKDQLDFQLNPRNLGKMRVTLLVQNDRTNVQIQTETSAAASMLSESEARLAQMLEVSGLRLGNLSSGQFNGFGGNASDQHAAHRDQTKTRIGTNAQSDNIEDIANGLLETSKGRSENLINIQA